MTPPPLPSVKLNLDVPSNRVKLATVNKYGQMRIHKKEKNIWSSE